eukprot:11480400-Alexandrium_andersonii.AAC.1
MDKDTDIKISGRPAAKIASLLGKTVGETKWLQIGQVSGKLVDPTAVITKIFEKIKSDGKLRDKIDFDVMKAREMEAIVMSR